LGSQLIDFIPKHSYLFTDEGYPFLQGIYKNHRMVNHSVKTRDKRYRFSRNRWCQNGVHNQVAEGYNNTIKTAIRSYGYFKPENAGLFLAEFSLMANIRHYGLDAILKMGIGSGNTLGEIVGLVSREYPQNVNRFLREAISNRKCSTKSHLEIKKEFKNKAFNKSNKDLQSILTLTKWKRLQRECNLFDSIIEKKDFIPKFKRSREKVYFRLSQEIWSKIIGRKNFINLNEIIQTNQFHRHKTIRIIRKWNQLGIVDIIDRTKENQNQIHYFIKLNLKKSSLPHLFYMYSRTEYLTRKTTKLRREVK